MKFKKYVESLNKLLEERPETAEFDVVTSKDDEGNGFNLVHYSPSVGNYDADDGDFSSEDSMNEFDELDESYDTDDSDDSDNLNAVCVN